MDRLKLIRQKEREYHEEAYEQFELFQPGTWLHKPVASLMELLVLFENNASLNVLDLGSGVGRNSIPVAQFMKNKAGRVVCVDLLDSAVSKLTAYSHKYGVSDKIRPVLSEISAYPIPERYFDLIFSVSALEHLDSEESFLEVIQCMIGGTKPGGVNALIMSTGVSETDKLSGQSLEPMYELVFETDSLMGLLKEKYAGWELLKQTVKPYAVDIVRDGRPIKLQSDVVTWIVRKR